MRKRILAGFAALALLLAGCSAGTPKSPASQAPASGPLGGELTLYAYPWDVRVKQAIDDFAVDYPDVKVNAVYIDSVQQMEQTAQTIQGQMEDGGGPDVLLFQNAGYLDAEQLYKDGRLLDLTPYMDEAETAQYFPEAIRACQREDEMPLWPVTMSIPHFVTTAQRLQAAGLNIRSSGYTQEDLLSVIENLLDREEASGAFSVFSMDANDPLLSMYYANGQPIASADEQVACIPEAQLRRLADISRRILYASGTDQLKASQVEEDSRNGLPAKKIQQSELFFCSYPIAGSAMLFDAVYDQLYGEQVMVLPMPDAEGGITPTLNLFGGVNANSKNPAAAAKLLMAMADGYNMRAMVSQLAIPVRADLYEESVKSFGGGTMDLSDGQKLSCRPLPEALLQQMLDLPNQFTRCQLPQRRQWQPIMEELQAYLVRGESDFSADYARLARRMEALE